MSADRFCADCGGTATQHSLEESCWCPRCLTANEPCIVFRPGSPTATTVTPGVPQDRAALASAIGALRPGSVRKEVYDAVRNATYRGLTDDEIEQTTGRAHQSASATRNGLMNDGLVVDSGQRRPNRYKNMAIVWIAAGLPPQR